MSLFQPPLNYQLVADWYQQQVDRPDRRYEQKRDETERDLLDTLDICPISPELYSEAHLKLNVERVEDFLFDEYYDTEKLKHLQCALKSIFMPSVGHITVQQKIKDWIRNPKIIGTPSKNGYVMIANFTQINDLIILKSPKKKQRDLNHEYFVGTILNNLRRKIPNFALVLGGFKCSPPFFEKKEPEIWCNIDNPNISVQYVLYENIAPARRVIDVVKSSKFNNFLPYLLQIAFSLKEAEVYEFSHNDLHLDNIMIRKNTTNKKWIQYRHHNRLVYIKANEIATFIDFGEANITVLGEKFGTTGNEKIGVYRDTANPVRDFIRFFLSAAIEAVNSNFNFYKQAERFIMSLFSDYYDHNDLLKYEQMWFALPPPNYFLKYPKMDDIIDLLQKVYPANFKYYVHDQPQSNERVMSCEVEGNCADENEAYQYFGLANYNPIKDLYYFHDIFVNQRDPEALIQSFDKRQVSRLIRQANTELSEFRNQIVKLHLDLRRVTLGQKDFDVFINSLRKIDRYFKQIIKLHDLTLDHHRLTEVLNLVESIYETGLYVNTEFDYDMYIWSELTRAKELTRDIFDIFNTQQLVKLSLEEKAAIDEIYVLIELINSI